MSQHINNLQSSYSYKEYVEGYLKDSLSPLANAGQRFGINAAGVKYVQKTCADIFNINYDGYDPNDLLLKLTIKYNSLQNIQVIDKQTGIALNSNNMTKTDFNNELVLSNIDDSLINNLINYSFNDIDKISNDSYITINNELFTGFIKGRLNQEQHNSKLIYFQYDVMHNKLLHNIVTCYYGKINKYDDWYIVYKLDYIKEYDNKSEYDLSIYLFRLEWLVNYILKFYNLSDSDKTKYESLINNFYDFESEGQKNILFSIFNSNFENYNNFTYTGAVIDYVSFLNFIFTYDNKSLTNDSYIKSSYNINFINDNIPDSQDFNNIIVNSKIAHYVSKADLSLYFSNIQNLYSIYHQLYVYYNQITYFHPDNITYLYKYIIFKLYNHLQSEFETETDGIIYIPLTYSFNCFVNDNNEYMLYYIDTIYVKFISDLVNISEFKNQIYYLNQEIINHTSIYKIHVTYNTNINGVINDININKLYTLPYLNKLDNWVIDEADTTTSIAQNQYAGIKELFIYTSLVDNKLNGTVLNISDESIIKYFNLKTKEFTIHNKYFLKFNGISVKCKTLIPDLSESTQNVIDFFKNTIIISISDKNILGEYAEDYAYDYVYSLWNYDELNNEFNLVTLDNIYAFDPYNNMSVINREQTYKFIQSLATSRLITNKQSSVITDNNYLILRNRYGADYNSEYHNNYNAFIEYVANIKEDGTNPNYNATKFITSIQDTPITNNIYPVYDIVFSVESINQLQTSLQQYNRPEYITYVTIIVNGQNQLSTELKSEIYMQSFYKEVEDLVTEYKIIEVGIIKNYGNNSSKNNYNEYVFNKNVPTIDLKEVFVRNNNTLNRINLLGVGSDADSNDTQIYNGFIGTKYDSNNKNIMYISTSENNINVGTDTLLDMNQFNKFNKYDEFHIEEFNKIKLISTSNNYIEVNQDNIKVNSKNHIDINNIIQTVNNPIIKKQNQNITTYTVSIIPQGRVNKNMYVLYNYTYADTLDINVSDTLENIYNTTFVPVYGAYQQQNISNITEYIPFYNSINLNNVLEELFGSDFMMNNAFTYVCSNTNRILECDIHNTKYHFLLFNDQSLPDIEINETDKIFNTYKVVNYKLNITLLIDTDGINYVYVNFENDDLLTLNKEITDDNVNDRASLSKILILFNIMFTNTIQNPNINYINY